MPIMHRRRRRYLLAVAALGTLAIAGCSDTSAPVPVASVTVTPASSDALVGGTVQLTAVAKDAQGNALADRAITWSTASATVATVNASGLVTAVGAGTATISATSEGRSGSATITVSVPQVPVASVSIAATTQPIERTTTQQLVATTRDASNNVLTGRTVTWSSSAPTIASVDPGTGLVTALDRGRATITATSETKSATAAIEVVILYRSITAGDGFSCDLGSIGVATCWGYNGFQDGRLGNGALDNSSLNDSSVPVTVLGSQKFTTISSGARHGCGLTASGAAYCWGSNGGGQLGNPGIPSWAHQPVPVAGGLTFTAISAGYTHTCALTSTGAAYCWGLNGEGELGNGTQTRSDTPVAVSGGISFASINAGESTGNNAVTCGVATDGRGFCWGSDVYGQIGDGGTISNLTTDVKLVPTQVASSTSFRSIAVGTFHVCGILTTGSVVCWGNNASSRLGIDHNSPSSSSPVAIASSETFVQVDAGYQNSCGITSANALVCWGANTNGESGAADVIGTAGALPALASPGEWSEVRVGATSLHACAISRDRLSVKCFGMNDHGQLGNGATTGVNVANATPQAVVGQQPLP